jgi:hypothetical protein
MIESTFYGLWPSARSAYYQKCYPIAIDGTQKLVREGPGGIPELGARDLCQSVVIPTMVPGAVGEAISTSARIARRSTFFSEGDGCLSRIPGTPWPEVGGASENLFPAGLLSLDPTRNGTTQAQIGPLTDRNELKTGNWPSCASGLKFP